MHKTVAISYDKVDGTSFKSYLVTLEPNLATNKVLSDLDSKLCGGS